MSLFERKFYVVDHFDNLHKMTAKELCERIKEDSRSDYNWIAPARNLVRICRSPKFPEEYAIIIKSAILNCFANIENRANWGGDRHHLNIEDEEAIEYCYNSMFGIDSEKVCSVRKKFLRAKLETASYLRTLDSHYHSGPTYYKLREDWKKAKFEEYIIKEKIDFNNMVETLAADFIEVVKKAESNGDFEEDDRKEAEKKEALFTKVWEI